MSYRRNKTSGRLSQHLALEVLEDRLAMAGVIQGTLWNDQAIDGVRGVSEPGLEGRTVFLDQNQNHLLDASELSTTTDSAGTYQFDNLAAGAYHVAQVLPAGWHQAWPLVGSRTVTLSEPQQTRFDFERYISPTNRTIPAFREAGFVFDTSVPFATKLQIYAPAAVDNYGGSTALAAQWTPSTLSLRKEDGGAFSLLAMDLGEISRTAGPATVVFTGRRADGSAVMQTASLDGVWGFETVVFSGFDDVVEVTWVSSSASLHQFDNVLVQTAALVAQGVDLGSVQSLLRALIVFDVNVSEPASGQADAVFELVLSRPHTSPLVVQYSTVAGDAAAGADFVVPSNGRVTFLAGQTRVDVTVQVVADALDEPNEVFFLRVLSAVGTTPVRNFGVATIVANRPPLAGDDAYAVTEDQVLAASVADGVLANDSDPDGDPLSAVLVAGPLHGRLVFNATGDFTYTPHADFLGVDTFTYRASDGNLESALATVTIETHKSVGDGQVTLDAAGVLRVGGTAGNDQIHIHATRARGEEQLVVRLNGQRVSFRLSLVQEVRAWGRAGNDQITMPNVALAGQFFGGAGNDALHGGFANDLLFGGSGHDMLIGGQGDDLLVGGAGHDFLAGNKGNDLLAGGEFLDLKTLGELSQLHGIWSSGVSFDFASLACSDDAFDILIGGSGRDLFFASLVDLYDRTSSRADLSFRR